MKRTGVIDCAPQNMGELANEIKNLQSVIWHLVYRAHPHSPRFCDGCEKAQRVIDEVSGEPLEP